MKEIKRTKGQLEVIVKKDKEQVKELETEIEKFHNSYNIYSVTNSIADLNVAKIHLEIAQDELEILQLRETLSEVKNKLEEIAEEVNETHCLRFSDYISSRKRRLEQLKEAIAIIDGNDKESGLEEQITALEGTHYMERFTKVE